MGEDRRENSRRSFLKSTPLVAISTATLPSGVRPLLAEDANTETKPTQFVTPSERAFLKAAVDRLIPRDQLGPGAVEAGVVDYIDLQMAGPWRRGEQLYRHGPSREGTPSQGYQLEYTPAELFRRSISVIHEHFSGQNTSFDKLTAEQKDA